MYLNISCIYFVNKATYSIFGQQLLGFKRN